MNLSLSLSLTPGRNSKSLSREILNLELYATHPSLRLTDAITVVLASPCPEYGVVCVNGSASWWTFVMFVSVFVVLFVLIIVYQHFCVASKVFVYIRSPGECDYRM